MKYFSLQLNVKSTLVIRSDHAAEGASSTKYIGGNTLLGCLAATHRLLYADREEEFSQFFLQGKIYFPDLLPANLSVADEDKRASHGDGDSSIYVIPKTAQSCKRYKGFLPLKYEKNPDTHGVRDSLLDWACFALSEQQQQTRVIEELEAHKKCVVEKCGNPLDHMSGYYWRKNEETRVITSVKTRLRTHTGINPETGTVADAILYNRNVFVEGSRFWGLLKIDADEELCKRFNTFIEEAKKRNLLRMGTGRSRGMGLVEMRLGDMDADVERSQKQLRKRLDDFNDKLHEPLRKYDITGMESKYFFAVTLHSPLISKDDALRYRGSLDGGTLARMLALSERYQAVKLEQVYQNASVRRIMGWQELWGTPRAYEFAIDAGSVFLFAYDGKPENDFYEALGRLETHGMGERRTEGFGRVCVSDNFHLEDKQR